MVSAFGSTGTSEFDGQENRADDYSDSPTSNGADPVKTAQDLATWVKQYGLDGVDIDYEGWSLSIMA